MKHSITKTLQSLGAGPLDQRVANSIESEIRAALGYPGTQERMLTQLDRIEGSLQLLIGAHYRSAVMHFREGALDKCNDQLISAVATDYLHRPSWEFYASLAALRGNYSLAVQNWWQALELFNVSTTAPKSLTDLHRSVTDSNRSWSPLEPRKFDCDETWFPVYIWIRNGFLVVRTRSFTLSSTTSIPSPIPRYGTSVFDYSTTKRIVDDTRARVTLAVMTNRVAVVGAESSGYIAYDLKSGEAHGKRFSAREVQKLFNLSDDPYSWTSHEAGCHTACKVGRWSETISKSFKFEVETWHVDIMGQRYNDMHGGTLIVSRS